MDVRSRMSVGARMGNAGRSSTVQRSAAARAACVGSGCTFRTRHQLGSAVRACVWAAPAGRADATAGHCHHAAVTAGRSSGA